MSGAMVLEEDVQIPLGIGSSADFRKWALSVGHVCADVRKDTRRLPEAYFDAGVGEYWLVDA